MGLFAWCRLPSLVVPVCDYRHSSKPTSKRSLVSIPVEYGGSIAWNPASVAPQRRPDPSKAFGCDPHNRPLSQVGGSPCACVMRQCSGSGSLTMRSYMPERRGTPCRLCKVCRKTHPSYDGAFPYPPRIRGADSEIAKSLCCCTMVQIVQLGQH